MVLTLKKSFPTQTTKLIILMIGNDSGINLMYVMFTYSMVIIRYFYTEKAVKAVSALFYKNKLILINRYFNLALNDL